MDEHLRQQLRESIMPLGEKIATTTLRIKAIPHTKVNTETGQKDYVCTEYFCPLCNSYYGSKYNPEFTKCKSCGIGLSWGKHAPHITKETIYNVVWDD